MAISQNFSSVKSSLSLNFAKSKRLDSRITFTRTTTGTYIDEDKLVKIAPANTPRFEHNQSTGECLGLLIENQNTNLLLYSEELDNQTAWVRQNSHPVTANSVISPDGTQNADTVYRTATNQFLYQFITGTGTFTLSAWVRSQNATGSFTMQPYNVTDGNPGVQTYTATNVWQRFNITSTVTQNSNWYPCIPVNTNENFYVWGVQLEQFPYRTSYIPTTTASATRAADFASITGTNFSSFYNPFEGTFYASFIKNGLGFANYPGVVYVDDGTANNTIGFFVDDNASDRLGFEAYISNVGQFQMTTTPALTSGQSYKTAGAYKINDTAVSFSTNTSVLTDTTVGIPTVNRMVIGQLRGSNGQLAGTISQLVYYPDRLSNTQLLALTR